MRSKRLVAAAATIVAAGGTAASAQAAPVSYGCSASALKATVAGQPAANPITSGSDAGPCSIGVAGLPNTGEVLGISGTITAKTAYAATDVQQAFPIKQTPRASAGVEGLSLLGGVGGAIQVSAATSELSASCVNGAVAYVPKSNTGTITLGGTPIVLDGVTQPLTEALTSALDAVLSVKLNEVTDVPGGGKVVRAAHIQVLNGAGTLLDVIVAESRLTNAGNVCDPNAEGNGGGATSGSGLGGGSGSGGSGGGATVVGKPCPIGSVYVTRDEVCVIPAAGSQTATNPIGDVTGAGAVTIGAPVDLPSGGRVYTLAQARKLTRSACLRGAGPQWAVLGTSRNDRITGGNAAERILGLGGTDKLDGGRGNDCIDGGSGRDVMAGGQDDDRVFGGTGNDSLNGDIGNVRLSGGAGNDTLVSGYGKDQLFGGAGNDILNAGVAGAKQRISGGPGRDVARLQRYDKSTGVERRVLLG